MVQHTSNDFVPSNRSGADLGKIMEALHSMHSGASRPSYAKDGMLWVKEVSAVRRELVICVGPLDPMIVAINPANGAVIDAADFLRDAEKLGGFEVSKYARTDISVDFSDTVRFDSYAFMNTPGQGLVFNSDTALQTTITFRQDYEHVASMQLTAPGDVNFNMLGGRKVLVNGQEVMHRGNLDAAALMTGTVPDERLPERLGKNPRAVSDWHEVAEPGLYHGFDAANAPGAGWWLGSAQYHGDDWITLRVHQFTADNEEDTRVWECDKNSGVWTPWRRIYKTASEIKGLISEVLATRTIAENDTVVSVDFTEFDHAKYSHYEFEFQGVKPTQDARFQMLLSPNAGASFAAGATAYETMHFAVTAGGNSAVHGIHSWMAISGFEGSQYGIGAGTDGLNGFLSLFDAPVGKRTRISGEARYREAPNNILAINFISSERLSIEQATGVRFQLSVGTFAGGKIIMRGIPK